MSKVRAVPGGQVMFCENCGVEAPTLPVTFNRVTGMLIVMQYQTFSGSMCKNCALRIYKKTQLLNLVGGWWGYISFVVNIAFLATNCATWLRVRNMPEVPPGARISPHFGKVAPQFVPPVNPQQRAQGDQLRGYIHSMIAQGHNDEQIAAALSQAYGLAPDVAAQFVHTVRNTPVAAPVPQGPGGVRLPAQRRPLTAVANQADIAQREAMAARRAAEAESARQRQAAAKAKRDAEMTRLAQRAKAPPQ